MRLGKHSILLQGYNVIQAIEECGASEKLTHAVILAGEFLAEVEKMVDLVYGMHNDIGLAHDAVHERMKNSGFTVGGRGRDDDAIPPPPPKPIEKQPRKIDKDIWS